MALLKYPLLVVRAATVVLAIACSGNGTGPSGPAITKLAGDNQQGAAGTLLPSPVSVTVRSASGAALPNVDVFFSVVAGGGAISDTVVSTDAGGVATTEWYLGPAAETTNTLRATADNASAEFTTQSVAPVAGQVYFGAEQYMEYLAGDLPIVISAPHGGGLEPVTIADRTGTGIETARDLRTEELAREIRDAFFTRTGHRPHVIICRLRRNKLDANRDLAEAAMGNRIAQRAWYEWHAFITAAESRVAAGYPRGLYMDLHGHGHMIQRLELGYLLTAAELQMNDASLASAAFVNISSLRSLVQSSGTSLPQLLRGPFSLGALFELEGYAAVPSPSQPDPGASAYFSGGYNTERHGSLNGGNISGFQLEANNTGVRDTQANRLLFADALVDVFIEYMMQHFRIDIS